MQQEIIISFTGDTKGLEPAIDILQKLGKVSEADAIAAKKMAEQWKLQEKAIADGAKQSISQVERFADAYKTLVEKIAKGAIDNTFTDIADAMAQIDPEMALLVKGLGDMENASEFAAQTIAVLENQLSQLTKGTEEFEILSGAIDGLRDGLKDLSTVTDGAGGGLDKIADDAQQSEKKFKGPRQQLKELRLEIQQLSEEGASADALRPLIDRAGELQDLIGDVNDEIEYMASDTKLRDTASSIGEGVAGAYSAVTSGVALLGGETEQLEKAFFKAQAAIAVVTGAMTVLNTVNRSSALMQGIIYLQSLAQTKANNLEAASTWRKIAAQRIYNAVAKANPYVLLAAAVITVVGAIGTYIIATRKASKEAEELKKRQETLNEVYKSAASQIGTQMATYRKLQAQWNALGDSLSKQKKFISENKDEFKSLGIEVNNVKDAENLLVKNTEAFEKAMIKRAMSTAYMNVAAKKFEEYINKMREVETNEIGFFESVADDFLAGMKASGEAVADQFITGGDIFKFYKKNFDERKKAQAQARKSNMNDEAEGLKQEFADLVKEGIKAQEEMAALLSDAGLKDLDKGSKDKLEALKKAAEAEIKARNDLNKLIAASESKAAKAVSQSGIVGYDTRIKAAEAYKNSLLKLIEGERKAAADELERNVKDAKNRADQKALIDETARQKAVEAETEHSEMLLKIHTDRKEREKKLNEDFYKTYSGSLSQNIDDQKAINDQILENELVSLSEKYAAGLIKEKEYQKQRQKIIDQSKIQAIKTEIDAIESVLDNQKLSDADRLSWSEKLADRKKQLATEVADHEIAENERSGEKQKKKEEELQQAKEKLIEAAFDIASQFAQAAFDNKAAMLDQELASLNNFYTTDAEAAKKNSNLKLISEEEMARRTAAIKNKQAKAEKEAAVWQATIAAFVGAAKALPNIYLAAVVLAAGLAQAAIISSKPIPKYAKGRKGGQGEFAVVGEKGPEIMYVPGGASIIPAGESMQINRILSRWNAPNIPVPSDAARTAAVTGGSEKIDYDKLGAAVGRNVRIPKSDNVHINMDENGFAKYLSEGNTGSRIYNNRYT